MAKLVQVYRRRDDLWDWRVVETQNGETLAGSEQGYTEPNDAEEGWERLENAILEATGAVPGWELDRLPRVRVDWREVT